MSSSTALNLRVLFVAAVFAVIGGLVYLSGWFACEAEQSSPRSAHVDESDPGSLDGVPVHGDSAAPEAVAELAASPISEWRQAVAALNEGLPERGWRHRY